MLIYIDTNILLDLSRYNKVDPDTLRLMRKKLYNKDIRIPQIVLGEAVTQILDKTDDIAKISEYLENLKEALLKLKCIEQKFPTTTNKIIKCARELQNKSDVVKHMDSLILAHPIVDNDATHFYTKDKWLKNDKVREYIQNLKEQKIRTRELNIQEDFTGE